MTRIFLVCFLSYFCLRLYFSLLPYSSGYFKGLSPFLKSPPCSHSDLLLMTSPSILHRSKRLGRQHLQSSFTTPVHLHLSPHSDFSPVTIFLQIIFIFLQNSLPSCVCKNCISFIQLKDFTLTILQVVSCSIILFIPLALSILLNKKLFNLKSFPSYTEAWLKNKKIVYF